MKAQTKPQAKRTENGNASQGVVIDVLYSPHANYAQAKAYPPMPEGDFGEPLLGKGSYIWRPRPEGGRRLQVDAMKARDRAIDLALN